MHRSKARSHCYLLCAQIGHDHPLSPCGCFSPSVSLDAGTCSRTSGCDFELGVFEFHGEDRSGVVLPLVPGLEGGRGSSRELIVQYHDEGRPDRRDQTVVGVSVTGSRKLGDAYSVTLANGNPLTILYDPREYAENRRTQGIF